MIGDFDIGPAQVWMAEGGVPGHELANCMEWAFGEGWRFAIAVQDLARLWNEKHSDLFKVNPRRDKISIFFWSVGKAYMEINFEGGKKSSFTHARRKRKIYSISGLLRGRGKGGGF